MFVWRRYPQRMRLICLLAGILGGGAVGALYSSFVSDYVLSAALVSVSGFFLFRQYGLAVFYLVIAAFLIGYWWTAQYAEFVNLEHPLEYSGSARVVSSKLVGTARSKVVFRLLDGEKAGTDVEAKIYDWGIADGSRIEVTGRIEPSDFSGHKGKGIIGTFPEVEVGEVLDRPDRLTAFRSQIQERVGSALPEPYSSLAVGLVTGATDDFDTSFRDDLSRTGTSHIVAVSGSNLTVVSLLLMRLGKRRGRWFGLCLALFGLVVYVVMAGASPAVLRGAVMSTLAMVALVSGRLTHRVPLLLLAAVVLMALFPLGMLYSLSWQLSFLAFAGIIFVGPLLSGYVKALGVIGQSIAETVAAEIMVLPLLLFQFGELSVVGPFVNAVVLAIAPIAMAVSFFQSCVSLVSVGLGRWFTWVSYPILFLVVKPIQWASDLPFASYKINHYPVHYFVASYVGVGLLVIVLLVLHRSKNEV